MKRPDEVEHVMTLGCAHSFHTVCIQTWLLHANHCPLCRTVVPDAARPVCHDAFHTFGVDPMHHEDGATQSVSRWWELGGRRDDDPNGNNDIWSALQSLDDEEPPPDTHLISFARQQACIDQDDVRMNGLTAGEYAHQELDTFHTRRAVGDMRDTGSMGTMGYWFPGRGATAWVTSS